MSNNDFLASNSTVMIEKLHNRHQAKLLDEIEKSIDDLTPESLKALIKKHLSFYTNDIKEQVIERIYENTKTKK